MEKGYNDEKMPNEKNIEMMIIEYQNLNTLKYDLSDKDFNSSNNNLKNEVNNKEVKILNEERVKK